jgi:hypothetical protein
VNHRAEVERNIEAEVERSIELIRAAKQRRGGTDGLRPAELDAILPPPERPANRGPGPRPDVKGYCFDAGVYRVRFRAGSGIVSLGSFATEDEARRVVADYRKGIVRPPERRPDARLGTGEGVYRTPAGRWVAKVRVNGAAIHLGTFQTKREARAVRAAKVAELRKGPTNGTT